MAIDIAERLRETRRGAIVREFFTNSAHFPLANLFLEMLHEGVPAFFYEPDLYVLVLAAAVQATVIGMWRHGGRDRPLVGNLVGPTLYTAIEVALDGLAFFASPYHVAYWGFALAVGVLQSLRLRLRGRARGAVLVAEHVVRSSILLGMYWIFEALTDPDYVTLRGFLSDESHAFVSIVIPLLGLLLGAADVTARRNLVLLRRTAARLREYSEWLLGRDLLSRAVDDPAELSLRRRERAVLFMDIRGFTRWSDPRPPEQVVDMLNTYFEAAEEVFAGTGVIKVQHTADEIMAVFAEAAEAARTALALQARLAPELACHGLGAGTGVNTGPVAEGLLGSRNVKGYSVIGDMVNTAKRICDQAAAGEVLISAAVRAALGPRALVAPRRDVEAKGKAEPLAVYPLLDLEEPAGGGAAA